MPRYPVEPAWETVVTAFFTGSPAPHAVTTRFTYTVPSNRFAVLQHAVVRCDISAGQGQLTADVAVFDAAGAFLDYVLLVFSRTAEQVTDHASPHLVLDTGMILRGRTLNIDAIARSFELSAHIIEVPK